MEHFFYWKKLSVLYQYEANDLQNNNNKRKLKFLPSIISYHSRISLTKEEYTQMECNRYLCFLMKTFAIDQKRCIQVANMWSHTRKRYQSSIKRSKASLSITYVCQWIELKSRKLYFQNCLPNSWSPPLCLVGSGCRMP